MLIEDGKSYPATLVNVAVYFEPLSTVVVFPVAKIVFSVGVVFALSVITNVTVFEPADPLTVTTTGPLIYSFLIVNAPVVESYV